MASFLGVLRFLWEKRKMLWFLQFLRCIRGSCRGFLRGGEGDDGDNRPISSDTSHHDIETPPPPPPPSSAALCSTPPGRTSFYSSSSGSANPNSDGSVNKFPLDKPSYSQTEKLTGLPPQPSPPAVNRIKLVDSSVDETIKCSPAKSSEGRSRSSGLAQSSSATKTTPASVKAPPSHSSTLSPISVAVKDSKCVTSTGYRPSFTVLGSSSATKATSASVKASPSHSSTLSPVSVAVKDCVTSTRNSPSSTLLVSSPSSSKETTLNLPREKKFSFVLSPILSDSSDLPKSNTYLQEGASLIYEFPEDIKILIERDIVPDVLKKPLSPRTYKDYFATLLSAEDFYCEKWNNFCLKSVTLKLEKASIYKKPSKNKSLDDSDEFDEKLFVVFEINLIPERRPFLLSRDFVFLSPAGKEVEPFKGILHRVVKRNRVLAEFDDDFHCWHSPEFEYDISFSFNRVCLKRSHQAIAATTNLLLQNFLFPAQFSRTRIFNPSFIPLHQKLDQKQISAVEQILKLGGLPAYLVESNNRERTGSVVQEAILQIYKNSPGCRILVTAPTNKTCDMLVESLNGKIPKVDIFRGNAAFREYLDVPDDIISLCKYEGECFTCPPLEVLQNYKVVSSTFMSSFRLHSKGLCAGHFSHVFLVDASSAMEPEALVVLTNLVDENTNVVVTGAYGNSPAWVRSDIGRKHGLGKSYFQRLMESEPYCSGDSLYVTHL